MDPVTLAFVTATAAGVAEKISSTLTGAAIPAAVGAYQALKKLITNRFGSTSKLSKAIDDLESEPESEGQKLVLQEKVKQAKADEDTEILAAAKELLAQLENVKHDDKSVTQIIRGDKNAVVAHGGTASVTIHSPGNQQ
ncbi:MAG: hypothetical protein U0175_09325 [Caldilineaceae bacterium]